MDSAISFNTDPAALHLEALAMAAPDTYFRDGVRAPLYIECRVLDLDEEDRRKKLKHRLWFSVSEAKAGRARQILARANLQRWSGGYNIYFAPAPRWRKARQKEDVAGSRLLWADLDRGFPALWPDIVPQASIIIESSPGKVQLYWLFEEFLADLPLLQDLNNRLAYLLGGDQIGDPPHILRAAGFPNVKYAEDPSRSCCGRTWRTRYPWPSSCLCPNNKLRPKTTRSRQGGGRKV